jgi:ABC-type glycerol-3-phosphate transport system permease component
MIVLRALFLIAAASLYVALPTLNVYFALQRYLLHRRLDHRR